MKMSQKEVEQLEHDMRMVSEFLMWNTVSAPGKRLRVKEVRDAFVAWCGDDSAQHMSPQKFGKYMDDISPYHVNRGRGGNKIVRGIALDLVD